MTKQQEFDAQKRELSKQMHDEEMAFEAEEQQKFHLKIMELKESHNQEIAAILKGHSIQEIRQRHEEQL